jgi:hypothetical protein
MTERILWDVGLQVDDDINIDELAGKWVYNDEHDCYGRITNVLIYSDWKFLNIGCDDEANEEIEAATNATLEETVSVFDMARYPHFYHFRYSRRIDCLVSKGTCRGRRSGKLTGTGSRRFL